MGLKRFEGQEVIGTAISVTNAGDGLSANMAIEPQEMKLHEEVIVVLKCVVAKITHLEVKDTKSLVRTHTLKAGTAVIASPELVAELLAAQEAKLEEARSASRMEFPDGEE